MLNNGFINLFKNLPNILTKFVCINKSVATKKGNKEGTTEFAHKESPFFIAGKLLEENRSKLPAKAKKIKVRIYRFSFII